LQSLYEDSKVHLDSNSQNETSLGSVDVATLLGKSVRMRLPLPKWGLGSPPKLPKVQSSIARAKTLHIEEFFISL
jgi:hypothetical protein